MSDKMWVIRGVKATEAEVVALQKMLQDSPAGKLLDKVLIKELDLAMTEVKACGASMDSVRQAQGKLYSVENLIQTLGVLVNWDTNQAMIEETNEEEENDVGLNVSF